MAVQSRIVLEPSAQAIVDATSTPPFIYELDPAAARKVLEDLQAAPIAELPIEEEWITVPAPVGDARVRIVRPAGSSGTLPVIVYMHGGGWILGNAATHDRLARELAVGAGAAYDEFAEGYYLSRKAMEWFWDAYIPGDEQRSEITASPNQATLGQLAGLPPTLLLVDEADVLCDEGEAYAAKLRRAGVLVTTGRYDGVVHDFMLLNAMSEARATRAAIAQATDHLRNAFSAT